MAKRTAYDREYKRKRRGSYCLACHLLIHYPDGSYRCARDGSPKDKMTPACRQRVKGRMRSHKEYYLEELARKKERGEK